MTKQGKQMLILLGVAAALVLAVFLLLRAPVGDETLLEEYDPIVIANRSPDDIQKITLEHTYGTLAIVQETEGNFAVEELQGLPQDETSLAALVDNCAIISAIRLVDDVAEDLALYGLGEPQSTVTVDYMDGERLELYVGDPAPQGKGVYATVGGGSEVYLLYTEKVTYWFYTATDLVTRILGEGIPANQIERAVLSGQNYPEPMVFERIQSESTLQQYGINTHRLVSPIDRELDSDRSSSLFTTAMGLTATAAATLEPDEFQIAAAGLDDPCAVFTLYYGDEVLVLKAGVAQGDTVYMMKEGSPVLYVVSPDSIPWYRVTYDQIISRVLHKAELSELSGLAFTFGEEVYDFMLEGDGEDMAVTMNGTAMNPDVFAEFYQRVAAMEGDQVIASQAVPTAGASASVTYRYRSGEVVTVYFVQGEDGYYAVNGGQSEFTVTSATLVQLKSNVLTMAEMTLE